MSVCGTAVIAGRSTHSRPNLHVGASVFAFCGIVVFTFHALALAADLAFQESETRSVEITERFIGFPDVYFDLDSMQLDEEAERDLQPVIDHLKAHPDGRVRLEGHVDDHYSNAYGLVLSGKRADLVKVYLRQHGITNLIETHGYSNSRPYCLERTEKCRRKNNRVHILVIEFREIPKPTPVAMSPESHGSAPRAGETPAPFEFPTVYFERNSFQLSKKARTRLNPLVEYLKSHPDLAIRLIGRVDERHTSAYGLPLSSHRAEAVQKFLRQNGVENTIQIVGVGKEDPICFEDNEACYRLSNQVDVVPGT